MGTHRSDQQIQLLLLADWGERIRALAYPADPRDKRIATVKGTAPHYFRALLASVRPDAVNPLPEETCHALP